MNEQHIYTSARFFSNRTFSELVYQCYVQRQEITLFHLKWSQSIYLHGEKYFSLKWILLLFHFCRKSCRSSFGPWPCRSDRQRHRIRNRCCCCRRCRRTLAPNRTAPRIQKTGSVSIHINKNYRRPCPLTFRQRCVVIE